MLGIFTNIFTHLIEVREVVGRETPGLRKVADVPKFLDVGRVLSVAVDPDLVLVLLLLNMGNQILWHFLREGDGAVVVLVPHAVQPVELEEDAGLPLIVSEGLLGAVAEQVDVKSQGSLPCCSKWSWSSPGEHALLSSLL